MSNVQKSFVTMGLTAVLSNVTNSVIEAEKKAKSSREIQTMHILRPGLRQDIFIGSLMVIPYSVMEDMDKVPLPLLRGAVMTLFAGEEAMELEAHRLAETEFDKLESKDFLKFKDKLFRDEDGKLGCLCVFLPAWANPRDYAGFRFIKDPEKLSQLLRHLVFAAYFRPSLSAMFDILEENQMQLDVVNIEHEHMGGFSELLSDTNVYPVLESGAGEVKTASVARKPFIRFAASEIDAIKGEILSGEEQAVMDQLTDAIVSKAAKKGSATCEANVKALKEAEPELVQKWLNILQEKNPASWQEVTKLYNDYISPTEWRGAFFDIAGEAGFDKTGATGGEAVPQRGDYNDRPTTGFDTTLDKVYPAGTPVCRKCKESLANNKSEHYCDKCNMPLKKYAGLDEAMQSSMMRFGEEPEDEQTITEAPHMADEGMVDRIAADAEMAVADNYLAEGDALDRVENINDEAYDEALEIAIYESMEKNKVPYNEAEELAAAVKAKILGQYGPTEVIDEVDTDITPDPELARELDNFYDGSIDSTEFESQPHAFTSSVEKISMMDFFNKCEKCGALTSVPPGEDPEGHGTVCADCTSGKVATPTAWSIDNTREEPSSDPLETSEEQLEEKKNAKTAEKATEYFDVVREEVQEPDGEEVADGEELKKPTEVLVAVDVLSEDFSGTAELKSTPDHTPETPKKEEKSEASKEKKENPFESKVDEPKEEKEETPEEEPKEATSAKKGGLKNAALGRRSLRSKQAISYFHPGDGLAEFAPEELDGVALHPEFSGDVEAPDLKLSSNTCIQCGQPATNHYKNKEGEIIESYCDACDTCSPDTESDSPSWNDTTHRYGSKTSGRKFAFDWMAPGQVLKEFQPDVLNQMLDHSQDEDDYHPVQPDAEIQPGDGQEVTREDYDCDESHSLTSPGLVSTESGGGTPLRSQERNIRGPFFMDQFYKIHADISPANLTIKSSINKKTASDIDGAMVVAEFLSKLSAEIASTLLAAFVVTDAPSFVGVPTTGTISLLNVGTDVMMSPLLGAAMNPITMQLKALLDNMNDSQLTEAINDAWAQSAVWKEAGTTSFLYEVFVRIEAVDTEAMVITYKFITDLKEK